MTPDSCTPPDSPTTPAPPPAVPTPVAALVTDQPRVVRARPPTREASLEPRASPLRGVEITLPDDCSAASQPCKSERGWAPPPQGGVVGTPANMIRPPPRQGRSRPGSARPLSSPGSNRAAGSSYTQATRVLRTASLSIRSRFRVTPRPAPSGICWMPSLASSQGSTISSSQ